MASGSLRSANNLRRRNRTDDTAYYMPGSIAPISDTGLSAPIFTICDLYGDTIELALVPLARALISLDVKLLQRVQKYYRRHDSSSLDEVFRTRNLPSMEEMNEITRQWKDIQSGRYNFSHLYMKNKRFVCIWAEGLRIIREVLQSNQISNNQSHKRSVFAHILTDCEKLANKLEDEMVDAAHKGLLEPEVFFSIQDRWIRLDEVVDAHYASCAQDFDNGEPQMLRNSRSWSEIRRLVSSEDPKAESDKEHIQIRSTNKLRKENEPGAKITDPERKHFSAFILWSAFFCCAVIFNASFALGYGRSSHLPGTTHDPDFWFLIQATVTQILGLVVSALLERKRGSLPTWRWGLPTLTAGTCAIVAIPLYLVVPKEWSSFLSAVAGATQTFMTLQFFLS